MDFTYLFLMQTPKLLADGKLQLFTIGNIACWLIHKKEDNDER